MMRQLPYRNRAVENLVDQRMWHGVKINTKKIGNMYPLLDNMNEKTKETGNRLLFKLESPDEDTLSQVLSGFKSHPRPTPKTFWGKLRLKTIDVFIVVSCTWLSSLFIGLGMFGTLLQRISGESFEYSRIESAASAERIGRATTNQLIILDIFEKTFVISLIAGAVFPFVFVMSAKLAKIVKENIIDPWRAEMILNKLDKLIDD